jgi:hypothetical protein
MHALDGAFLKLLPQSGSFRTMEIQGGTTMLAQGRDGLGITAYERHQPEQTLPYQLVEAYYPALIDQLDRQGKSLPDHVHRAISTHLIHKTGFSLKDGATGAVTLIQRFGSALNVSCPNKPLRVSLHLKWKSSPVALFSAAPWYCVSSTSRPIWTIFL